MVVNVTGANEVSLDIQTVGHVSAVDALMSVIIRAAVFHVVTTLVEHVVRDVLTVTMVIHDLVLLSHAVLACALVELEVDTNMATHVVLMLAITKSLVIVARGTVVQAVIDVLKTTLVTPWCQEALVNGVRAIAT